MANAGGYGVSKITGTVYSRIIRANHLDLVSHFVFANTTKTGFIFGEKRQRGRVTQQPSWRCGAILPFERVQYYDAGETRLDALV